MNKKTCVAMILSVALLLLPLPDRSHADTTAGDLTISGDSHYTYDPVARTLTITGDGTYRIGLSSGITSTSDMIIIAPSVEATVTFAGLPVIAHAAERPRSVLSDASVCLLIWMGLLICLRVWMMWTVRRYMRLQELRLQSMIQTSAPPCREAELIYWAARTDPKERR